MPRFNPHAPAPTGPILRLTVQTLAFTQVYEMVLDYMASTGPSPSFADLSTFLANWRAANELALTNLLNTTTDITGYTVSEQVFGTVPTLVNPLAVPVPGTVAGVQTNGMLAAVITKYSPLKGQHGRGRVYVPAIPNTFESATDPNRLSAAALTAYTVFAGTLLLPIAVGGITYGLNISERPVSPQTLVSNATPVNRMVVEAVMGTIRRRREGRGI